MNIIIDKNINLIQEVRLIQALSESNFDIIIDKSQEEKIISLKKFNIKYKLNNNHKGISFKNIIKINHSVPETSIGDIKKTIIFPKAITDYLKSNWNDNKLYNYSFTGLLTSKRKNVLEEWIHKNQNINYRIDINKEYSINIGDLYLSSSKNGRTFPKKSWDSEYYNILLNSKFVICPSGDFIWSYRFFEAILCGAIPIIEEYCDTYDGFKFYYMKDDIKNLKYSKEVLEFNYKHCIEKITIENIFLNQTLNKLS
jgi:hypothetical protein